MEQLAEQPTQKAAGWKYTEPGAKEGEVGMIFAMIEHVRQQEMVKPG